MDATMSAQVARKCPHGTRATSERGWSRQTSHLSDVADESVEVVTLAVSSSTAWAAGSDLSSPSSCICSGCVCIMLWLTARRNCIRVYSPLSYTCRSISAGASRSSVAVSSVDVGSAVRLLDGRRDSIAMLTRDQRHRLTPDENVPFFSFAEPSQCCM